MKVAAIVPAAGKGKRLKSIIEKPYIKLSGNPILAYALIALAKNRNINEIILAVKKNKIEKVKKDIISKFKIKKVKIVEGGKERKDSVFNALKKVSKDVDYVLIHDGIRPFITDKLINAALDAARRFGASVVAVPVKSTLKRVTKKGYIRSTADRRFFWEAQTPQVFRKDLIEKAYTDIQRRTYITDDSMLVEMIGVRPKIVEGSYHNIKITTKDDLKIARRLIDKSSNPVCN